MYLNGCDNLLSDSEIVFRVLMKLFDQPGNFRQSWFGALEFANLCTSWLRGLTSQAARFHLYLIGRDNPFGLTKKSCSATE
jgi:hypothetical protein